MLDSRAHVQLDDLGMACRHGWNPVRLHGHGRDLLQYAHLRWPLLRLRRAGPARLGPSRGMDNRLEQLVRPDHRRAIRQLRYCVHDPGGGEYQ